MNDEKIIKCRVKSDSTFTDLIGYYLLVIRDKGFYKIDDITNFDGTFDEHLESLFQKYCGMYIGREQLDFQIEDLNEVVAGYIPVSTDEDIRTFESGAIRASDTKKEHYVECLSWSAMRRFGMYMREKEELYGKGNWKKGIPIEEYEESLFRHIQKYFANKYENAQIEPETDHLMGIYFNLQGIIHEEEKLKLNTK